MKENWLFTELDYQSLKFTNIIISMDSESEKKTLKII